MEEVDSELTRLGVPAEVKTRTSFLHQFMGITQDDIFNCGTPIENCETIIENRHYSFAIDNMIYLNKKQKNQIEPDFWD
jgi:hypothetical protein